MDTDLIHITIATILVLTWLVIVFGWFCTWERDTQDSSHAARFADRQGDTHQDKPAA
jgi:hypothetical protein